MAGGSASDVGSGGMATKIAAARIAVARRLPHVHRAGPRAASAAPDRSRRTLHVVRGRARSPSTVRKQWIAGTLQAAPATLRRRRGRRAGAARRQEPAAGGRRRIDGPFDRGDAVIVRDADGRWRSRAACRLFERRCAAHLRPRSREFEALLGFRGRDEMIHRDDLVLT